MSLKVCFFIIIISKICICYLLLDESPLFASPLPKVIKLLISYFDISLIGVKQRPSLDIAFKMLMKVKNDILTEQTASKLFAYLNTLEGLTNNIIKVISSSSFIPLQGSCIFNETYNYHIYLSSRSKYVC
jgi:hypothetical protein